MPESWVPRTSLESAKRLDDRSVAVVFARGNVVLAAGDEYHEADDRCGDADAADEVTDAKDEADEGKDRATDDRYPGGAGDGIRGSGDRRRLRWDEPVLKIRGRRLIVWRRWVFALRFVQRVLESLPELVVVLVRRLPITRIVSHGTPLFAAFLGRDLLRSR